MHRARAFLALICSGLLLAGCGKGTQSLADDPEFVLPSLTLGSPGAAGEYGRAVVFVGEFAAIGQPDRNEVHLFDADSGELVRTLRDRRANAGFGRALAVIGGELYVGAPGIDRVFRFDPATGEERAQIHIEAGEFGASLAVVGGELWVGAPGHDVGRGIVVRLALTSHVEIGRIPSPNAIVAGTFGSAIAETDSGAVVGAPGEAGGDGQAYLFTATGALDHAIAGPDGGGFGASVAAGAGTVVVGAPRAEEGRAYLIDAEDGDVARTLDGPAGGSSFGAAVGVDGPHVVVAGASDEAQLHVFRASNGAHERTISPAPDKGTPAGFAVATRNGVALVGIFQLQGNAGLATALDCTIGNVLIEFEAPTPASGQFYGEAVAIVGDRFVVASRNSQEVHVYGRDGNLERSITIADGPGVTSLASHGADQVVVGAPGAGNGEGRAFVYNVTNGNLVATLQEETPEADAEFGFSVDSDGVVIIVGAPGASLGTGCGAMEGEAIVFSFDFEVGLVLQPQTPESGGRFGESVAIDGSGFFVGSPFGMVAQSQEALLGLVAQFDRNTGQHIFDFFNDEALFDDALGASIDVRGGLLYAGAPDHTLFDDGTQTFFSGAGAVVVFDIAQQAVNNTLLSPNITDGGAFGASVQVRGERLIVGEPTGFLEPPLQLAGGRLPEGILHVFDRGSLIRLFALDGPLGEESSEFGTSVALSADGNLLISGAPGETRNAETNAGSALAFDTTAIVSAFSPNLEQDGEYGAATAGFGVDTILVGAAGENNGQGRVYFVNAASGQVTQTVPFPDTFGTAAFGHAIAVSDNLFAVSAPRAAGGRVYLFNEFGVLQRTFTSPASGGTFGQSIAFVETGTQTLLLIGEPGGNAAYLFDLNGNLVRTFGPPPLAGPVTSTFGFAVRGVGDLVAISDINRQNPNQTQGTVFIFDHTDGTNLSTLTPPNGGQTQFGNWLEIIDGTTLAVSQPFETATSGSVHLYDLQAGSFLSSIDAPAQGEVGFGREMIACSGLLVIGHPRLNSPGSIHVFNALGEEVLDIFSFNPSPGDLFGLGLGCLNGAPIIGSPGANVNPTGAGRAVFLTALQQTPPASFSAELTLESPDPQQTGFFSDSVAFVGNDLAIGASLEAPTLTGNAQRGAVHIYRGTDGVFQRTIRTPNANGSNRFGVSLSANATVLAVGSPEELSGGVDAGRAYLFSPTSGQLLIGFDSPNPEEGAGFGTNVSLSVANIAIGEPGATVNGLANAGRAHYFDCAVNQALMSFESPNPEAGGQFGQAVATCGNRIYVGAFGENELTGRVYCFDAFTGQLIHTIEAPQGATLFGITLAKFGNDLLVGATGGNGAVFLFSAATGQLVRTFANPDATPQLFGQSLASNGTDVLIGSPGANNGAGKAFLFNGNTGTLIREIESPRPQAGGNFAESVAISGNNHLIGALLEDGGATDSGRAYVNVSQNTGE